MFTGLIEAVGQVISFESGVLVVDSPFSDVRQGESIAVNGCCLTALEATSVLRFDLSPETIRRTAFEGLKSGDHVNLERAMRVGDRLGGHIVQGHVDGVGVCLGSEPAGDFVKMRFQIPEGAEKYLIDKGSIAISGVSLTVVGPRGNEFEVWLIPETLRETNLSNLLHGTRVNLEYDVIAKYVEKMMLVR